MVLGAPRALWALLLIPLVVLLYMLRARRQPQIVPSTLLWERATRDLVARMPVRRLERSILLLLQILAIAAAVLALARPSAILPGSAGDAVVLVLRTTASMQATDAAPSRFATAQRDALALLGRLGARQQAAVIDAGRRPRLVRDFTANRASLAAAIAAMRPTDAGGSIDDAVTLAAGLRADGRPARVHVFSDRPPVASPGQWHRIGSGAANMAITVAAARRDVRGWTLLVRIEAFGGTLPARTLTVTAGARTLAQRRVRPAPGSPHVVVLELGEASGILTVGLEGRDALPADDRALVAVGRETQPRVLVVGDPNPVLDIVLNAVPTASVTRAETVAPGTWSRADLVVLDGVSPLPLPPGAYLLIGTLGTNVPALVEGEFRDQVIKSISATHPVTRLTDLRGVRIAAGVHLKPQAGTVLAEGDVPLAWAYEGRGLRVVVVPFALAQSDLALSPGFPVLVANAVAWLAGGSHAVAGDTPVVAAGSLTAATLTRPDGGTIPVTARDGVFALPPLDRVGVYRLRATLLERTWVVSTVDAREGDLAVLAAQPTTGASAPAQSAHVSLVPWLLGAAAIIAFGEWMLWARTVPPAALGVRPR